MNTELRFVVAIVLVGRLALRPMLKSVAKAKSEEMFMAACLLVIIGADMVSALSGLSMALGAFVAGILLAETEYRHEVEVMPRSSPTTGGVRRPSRARGGVRVGRSRGFGSGGGWVAGGCRCGRRGRSGRGGLARGRCRGRVVGPASGRGS